MIYLIIFKILWEKRKISRQGKIIIIIDYAQRICVVCFITLSILYTFENFQDKIKKNYLP